MALIQRFEQRPNGLDHAHGPVLCGYRWFEDGGRRILQLDTYGSAKRAIPGKVSQSIQLDSEGAQQLISILRQVFGHTLIQEQAAMVCAKPKS